MNKVWAPEAWDDYIWWQNQDRKTLKRINALVKVEDLTGKSITALDLSHVGIKDLLIIVYAGLCHEDKTLTLEKVGDLIDEYSNITEIAEKLGEAFTLAFGKAEGKQGE